MVAGPASEALARHRPGPPTEGTQRVLSQLPLTHEGLGGVGPQVS